MISRHHGGGEGVQPDGGGAGDAATQAIAGRDRVDATVCVEGLGAVGDAYGQGNPKNVKFYSGDGRQDDALQWDGTSYSITAPRRRSRDGQPAKAKVTAMPTNKTLLRQTPGLISETFKHDAHVAGGIHELWEPGGSEYSADRSSSASARVTPLSQWPPQIACSSYGHRNHQTVNTRRGTLTGRGGDVKDIYVQREHDASQSELSGDERGHVDRRRPGIRGANHLVLMA